MGPDIYRDDAVRREVLFLAANFQSGDSGGPLGDAAGRVVGVAFAVAPDRSSTAYALPDEEIGAVLQAPATGRTGPCVR